jgi:DNA-binding response OmpR family regulator
MMTRTIGARSCSTETNASVAEGRGLEERMGRILLVEDDNDIRPLLEQLLLGDGYAVDVAATAATARAFIGANAYDLVLTDGVLPDGSGIEIADRVKRRGMKAIVLTGHPGADLAQHPYILKPVKPQELLDMITRHIAAA